jgi:hypothetical protein
VLWVRRRGGREPGSLAMNALVGLEKMGDIDPD